MAAKRAARWETDLSGGGVSEPLSGPEGSNVRERHALDPAALAVCPISAHHLDRPSRVASPATQSEIAPVRMSAAG